MKNKKSLQTIKGEKTMLPVPQKSDLRVGLSPVNGLGVFYFVGGKMNEYGDCNCRYDQKKYESLARRIVAEQAEKTRLHRQARNDLWRVVLSALAIYGLIIGMIWLCVLMIPKTTQAQIIPTPSILSVARNEIGKGEFLFDNYGGDIAKYLQGRQGLAWCAGFVSWCAQESGYKVPYTLSAKKFLNLGRQVCFAEARPGDIVVFTRPGGFHAGILEAKRGDNFVSIEGNTGKFPSKVKRLKHSNSDSNVYRYVRLSR